MTTQQDIKFDFNRMPEPKVAEPSKYATFMKMGASGVAIAIFLSGIGYGVNHIQKAYIEEQNAVIAQKEEFVKKTGIDAVKSAIGNEKGEAGKIFAKNQVLIADYANYPELVKLLKMNTNLANNIKGNASMLKDAQAKIDADLVKVEALEKANSRDDKVGVYLKGDNFKVFSSWDEAAKSGKPLYLDGLNNINKSINSDLSILSNTQKEITDKVRQRIQAKDFSLNDAEKKFSGQISQDKNKELGEIAGLKKSLEDNNEHVNPEELGEIEGSLETLATQTNAQIKQDRETVEKLIAEEESTVNTAVNNASNNVSNSNSNSTNTTHTAHNSNFGTYLLMYHWMNAGSAASYQSGFSAGTSAALARQAPPYTMTSNVTSSRISAYKSQLSSRVSVARSSISSKSSSVAKSTSVSRSGGFGRSGGFSSGG